MIEIKNDQLIFTFPEIHPQAKLSINFQRTLRIPDDGQAYPLPPGLGSFPLQHVDDHANNVPSKWLQHGGVMLPMYQSEAMWLNFDSVTVDEHWAPYPFAIKVATGKQCAVSGQSWVDRLNRKPQNYMVAPGQPWLDGYVVEEGLIRQFVAMPLGSGYTAEEQITGEAEHGGIQLAVYPMKRKAFEKRFPKRDRVFARMRCMDALGGDTMASTLAAPSCDMGLAPGGMMRQEIYDDPYRMKDWETDCSSRCFVHICNSLVWQSISGSNPPYPAPTSKQYNNSGLPWFDYYDDSKKAIEGSSKLAALKSVREMSMEKGEVVLPENESVSPNNLMVVRRGLKQGQVREFE